MVPEESLRAIATENGGRLNTVWDVEHKRFTIGRFGYKANQPSIKQQTANAFVEDIGITSTIFPIETCPAVETVCNGLINRKATELTNFQLAAVTEYVAKLAPPARRDEAQADVVHGERLFHDLGCSTCHRDTMVTASGFMFHPYTDLLLHDMGEGLADGRPDSAAGPQDWRTQPLWGIGLFDKVGDAASFLHDGRARTLDEAILWHGGEAQSAADRYRDLPKAELNALTAFLNSL